MLPTPFCVVDMFKRSHSDTIYYNAPKPSFMSTIPELVPLQHHFVSKILIPIKCH